MMPKNMIAVSRIRALCKAKNTTLAVLERKLGFGNGVIAKWEKAAKPAPYDRLSAVADALGVSVDYLTGAADTKKQHPTIDSGALLSDLPEEIQQLIRICSENPSLASALLVVAQQIEKGRAAQE